MATIVSPSLRNLDNAFTGSLLRGGRSKKHLLGIKKKFPIIKKLIRASRKIDSKNKFKSPKLVLLAPLGRIPESKKIQSLERGK